MTIQVNFVEGRKGQACNNDAFFVIQHDDKGGHNVLDVFPCEEVGYNCGENLHLAFSSAVNETKSNDLAEIKDRAHDYLKIYQVGDCAP